MPVAGISLIGLVEKAFDGCRANPPPDADESLFLCHGGQYRSACKVFDPDTLNAWPFSWSSWGDGELPAEWVEFSEALILAERIDSFLSVLERSGPEAALARDCRDNLDLLLVLADWCQDGGQVRAAAEATHLHELACSVYRSLTPRSEAPRSLLALPVVGPHVSPAETRLTVQQRKEIFRGLVLIQDLGDRTVPESIGHIAQQYRITSDRVRLIQEEGIENEWPPLGDSA